MISGGVLSSWPSQNGQRPGSVLGCISALKSCGRFARSCAMITQRPTIGSLRSSGIAASLEKRRTSAPACGRRSPGPESDLPHDPLEVGRRHGQLEDPLAGGAVEAGLALEQLDVE